MKTAFYVLGLIAAAALALWVSGVLASWGVGSAPFGRPGKTGDCTAASPCQIRFAFAVTESGARELPPQLLQRVARDDLKTFRRALRVSGALDGRPGRPSIQVVQPVILERPIDAGQADRIDTAAAWGDPVAFNNRLLRWLPRADRLKPAARDANVVVIFTGLRRADGACREEILAGDGYLLVPACLAEGYGQDPQAALKHRALFLREAAGLFGAPDSAGGDSQDLSAADVAAIKRAARGVAGRHAKVS